MLLRVPAGGSRSISPGSTPSPEQTGGLGVRTSTLPRRWSALLLAFGARKHGSSLRRRQPAALASTPQSSTSDPALAEAILIVRDPAQLRALQDTRALHSKRPLVLELPGLSPSEAQAASERIASYANECGCSFSAKCMVGSFSVAVIYLALGYGVWSAQFLWRLPLAVLFAFVWAGLGKWAAISRAHARINKELDRLIAIQPSFSKGEE
jgi:hypothetical protein